MSKAAEVIKAVTPSAAHAVMEYANGHPIIGTLAAMHAVGKGIKAVTNHPEFYTHYDTSNLVAMNLAGKQEVAYPQLSYQTPIAPGNASKRVAMMPSIARVTVQLTVPNGDMDGWRQGIRLLYQQLRTANSGKVNYTERDLEKYVLNLRSLHAVNAWLKRLYAATYTFRSTNNIIPQGILSAMGVDPDDIMANASNLFTYTQRFNQRVRTNFPLSCDLFTRTDWLFNHITVDSNAEKPSYYVTTFIQDLNTVGGASTILTGSLTKKHADGVFYFVTPGVELNNVYEVKTIFANKGFDDNGFVGYTYAEVYAECEKILTDLIDSRLMGFIAGDIIKAFGDKAFFCTDDININSTLEFIYDENDLSQWQNAMVMSIRRPFSNKADYRTIQRSSSYRLDATYTTGWVSSDIALSAGALLQGALTDSAELTHIDSLIDVSLMPKYNDVLVNWHASSIDPGHVMSITRLMPTQATHSVGDPGNYVGYMIFGTFGTEYITNVDYYYTMSQSDYGPKYLSYFIPIAGVIAYVPGNSSYGEISMGPDMSLVWLGWANFDWCPRIEQYVHRNGTNLNSSGGIALLDWDVFAEVDYVHLKTYYSYGNQSLLYCNVSQNQSNTEVYMHETVTSGKSGSSKKGNKKKKKKGGKPRQPKDQGDILKPDKK